MIRKKISMLGLWGAGKTSLVRRFINQVFDDKYHATLGVKIDTKEVEVNGQAVKLLLWDIAGSESNFDVPLHYIEGSDGFLLVIDGTRRESFEEGLDLVSLVEEKIAKIPYTIVVNKSDLDWQLTHEEIEKEFLGNKNWFPTSAKTGENVEKAFENLTQKLSLPNAP